MFQRKQDQGNEEGGGSKWGTRFTVLAFSGVLLSSFPFDVWVERSFFDQILILFVIISLLYGLAFSS